MPLRPTLMFALLATACAEPLPQAPEGCEGIQCGCQEHTDCPLTTPECLAGVCRESQATDIAWAHRDTVLPVSEDNPNSDLHGVDLERAIDLSKGSLVPNMNDQSPSPDWLLYSNADGHRIAVHVGGLLLIRPSSNGPRIWLPHPNQLTSTGPGAHPDLRALAGYDVLKQFILASTSAGMIRSRSPAQLLNAATHKVVLGKPFHHMIGDLIGPVTGRPAQLQIPDVSKLMARGYSMPHSTTFFTDNYPLPIHEVELIIGKTYEFTLQGEATLRIDGLLTTSADNCKVDLTVTINEQPKQTLTNWEEPFIQKLPSGDHTVTFEYPSKCPDNVDAMTGTHWARLSVHSDQPITLNHWSPSTPLPVDNNARPVLYNEPAGLLVDSDGDNWPDNSDLCPQDADDQSDGDQNGIGDACDGFYTVRSEAGRLIALNRTGERIGEITNESIHPSTRAAALTLPKTEIRYPSKDEINPYTTQGGIIFQATKGEPVYQWYPESEPVEIQGLWSESLARTRPSLVLKQIDSDHRHTAMHLIGRIRYQNTSFEVQILNMRTTVAVAPDPNLIIESVHYLYSGSEPAFVVAEPSEPLTLISDQFVGKTTFSAMRVHATSLIRFPHVLMLPPRNECTDNSDCPTLEENGLSIARSCVQGRCRADSTSGRCVMVNDPSRSTFNACVPTPRVVANNLMPWCSTVNRCARNSECAGSQCWAKGNENCALKEVCLPRNQTSEDFEGIPPRLLPDGLRAALDNGLMSPLAMAVGVDLAKATANKYLGIVQALPMNLGAEEIALTACPREWMDGRQDAYLTPDEQRQLLRNIFNPNVASNSIFEIAEVDANWVLPYSNEPPTSACRPLRSKWRGYFPSELAPQTAEFVDIDKDGINEFRVGFSVLERSQTAEPAVYRCFDFNGDHQANNCAP